MMQSYLDRAEAGSILPIARETHITASASPTLSTKSSMRGKTTPLPSTAFKKAGEIKTTEVTKEWPVSDRPTVQNRCISKKRKIFYSSLCQSSQISTRSRYRYCE